MQFKTRKNKGFTIVELVIVIAVIAILAAVLIPVFSNIVAKANESSAKQAATNSLKQYCIDNPNIRSFTDGGTNYYVAYFTVVRGGTSYIFRYGMDGELEEIDESDLPVFSGFLYAEVYDTPENINKGTDARTKLYKKKLSTGEYIYYQVSPADNDGNTSIIALFDVDRCYWVSGDEYYSLACLADIVFTEGVSGEDETKDESLETFKDAVGLVYQTNSNGKTSVVGYEGTETMVIIPNTASNGTPVTGINDGAFRDTAITAITMGENVKEIRSNAFTNCAKLQTVTLNDGIQVIWACAFSFCRKLSTINFPSSVNKIGSMAFKACDNLTDVVLPDGCSVCSGAFGEAAQISFANGTNSITDDTYIYYSLGGALVRELKTSSTGKELLCLRKDCAIPENQSITCIGTNCFSYDTITSVHIPDSVTELADRSFYANSSIKTITGGNGIKTIGTYAFYNCAELESFTISGTVEVLKAQAFSRCNKLSLTLKNGSSIENGAISGVKEIVLENNSEYHKVGGCVVNNNGEVCQCEYGATIPTDSSVTVLGTNCFAQSQLSGNVVIPSNITELQACCFHESLDIETLLVGNNIKKMGSSCFSYNTGLTRAVLACQITTLPEWTFAYCSSLTEVTLPQTIRSIGVYAFYKCTCLTTIRYGGTKADWQSITFGKNWNGFMPEFSVICSDGTLIYKQ